MACLFYRPVMDRSHMRNMAPCDHYLSCRITAGIFPTGSRMEPSFSSPCGYGSLPGERNVGPRWMQDPRVANCVMGTLIESEQAWKLCSLSAWVVTPNHVHARLCPFEKLSKVLLVIKSASARRANRLLERTGQRFWQDESFDHWVRNGHERNQIIRYTEWNPVKAELVAEPQNWPWSSASRTRSAA